MEDKNIINNQPTINIGMIGSVSNGKSSITEKLTGTKTQKHSSETKRNITIKLGYANMKIFKCHHCPAPICYQPHPSSVQDAQCNNCESGDNMELVKHVSFVDCPGHSLLMSTMLNGASIMDTTITVESSSNVELADQTKQHLLATTMSNIPNSIVCLNKMDLVKKNNALDKINKLKQQLIGTQAENSPIVPIAANYGINIDILCEYICNIKPPTRNLNDDLKMIIVRSFNINKQQIDLCQLEGGVIGGSLVSGTIKKGDKIIIYPGIIEVLETSIKEDKENKKGKTQKWKYKPLNATVLSLNSETNDLEFAVPGGLIGVKLDIDAGLTTKDGLIGNILTHSNNKNNYKVFEVLFVELQLVNDKQIIKKKDILVANFNAFNGKCEVVKIIDNKAEIKLLEKPICGQINDYITLSRQLGNNINIVSRAKILDGTQSVLVN